MSFTQNELRPAELEDGKLREIERDMAWLAERQPSFVAVACPACGGDGGLSFEKFGFRFEECPACRTVFMSPRASKAVMAEFYRRSTTYEFWNKHVFPASRQIRLQRVFQPRVERILRIAESRSIPTRVAMDVGASVGLFCTALRDAGRYDRVIALEPHAAQAATCRDLGLETIETDIFALDGLDSPLDLITAFEVIEHLFSPREFLVRCRDLLAPGGLLALTCPNQLGFDIQTLGEDSQSFDVEHVNMFNPRSLARLVGDCGLEVLDCSTPGEMDASIVRDAVLSGRLSLADQPFLRKVLVDDWERLGRPFQAFLKEQGLSSHLWLAAVRR